MARDNSKPEEEVIDVCLDASKEGELQHAEIQVKRMGDLFYVRFDVRDGFATPTNFRHAEETDTHPQSIIDAIHAAEGALINQDGIDEVKSFSDIVEDKYGIQSA